MKIKFCILEKDQKTFDYVKECLLLLERRDKDAKTLDNKIQAIEILAHLERAGKNIEESEERHKEQIFWVDNYACDFRSYLNTIKIAASFLHFKKVKSEVLSYEEFCECCDAVNNLKSLLLENIF